MLNSNNVLRYEFLKITRSISSLTYKPPSLHTLESTISSKTVEILTETSPSTRTKEILTILQLILCQSEILPPSILQELFSSILVIINSVSVVIQKIGGDDSEIREAVKTICLAVLNWEFKQSEEEYETVKKHQEEFILIKSQEIIIQCLRTGLLKHDIGHIIFEKFFGQATKKSFKLHSDQNESFLSSGETVIKEVMKNNLYILVDTLLAEKEMNSNMVQDMNKKTEKLILEAENNNKHHQDQLEIYLRVYQLILYKIDFNSQFEEIKEEKQGEMVAKSFHTIAESLFCLLSFCSELDNPSNDIYSLVYLIFDNICEFAERFPEQINYREEIELLMYRILIRPLDMRDEEDEVPNTEEDKAQTPEATPKKERYISQKVCIKGITDFITTKPNFVARMFMLYDCQPYSSNLAKKLLKCMSQISQTKFSVESSSDYNLIVKDSVKSQIEYLEIMSAFLKRLDIKPINKEAQEKIKFLLTNKNKIFKVEKSLVEKGRKGVKGSIENYIGSDSDKISQKLAEFLLYSRRIQVDAVLELIGHKDEIELLKSFLYQFKPLIRNLNVEQSIRKFFTSFRLAGVESQVVERVLENFGKFYYSFHLDFDKEDGIVKFITEKESFEFVYLLLMLHTCHHNPNIENKTSFKWYLDSVKDMCKESFPTMQEKDLKDIFESVEQFEFDSPTTRKLFDKKFSTESLPIELDVRTKISPATPASLSEADFLNCLLFETPKKLFHYHNNFSIPSTLLDLSKMYISELIFKDIKTLLNENIESCNFVLLFDKLFEICSIFGREHVLEELMCNMYEKIGWSKYYPELSDMELNLISCFIIYLCKWVSRFPTIAPHVSAILFFGYENDLISDAIEVKAELGDFIEKIEEMTCSEAQTGLLSTFLPSVFSASKPKKHLYDELKQELKLGEPEIEVVTKFQMDLDLSLIEGVQLQKICSTLMNVSKTEFNIFYPSLIYNIITSNKGEPCFVLLESLPLYITNCLAFPEKDYISEYEELKFKIQKFYICEVVVKIMLHFHKQQHSLKDSSYFRSKKVVKALVQNIFEDLNCYEVDFLCSLSDAVADTIKSEKYPEQNEEAIQMLSINDEIFCLLISLMYNLNERSRGIVGFKKLELIKSQEESKIPESPSSTTQKAKEMIDAYFKIQSSRPDDITDESIRRDITRINNSAMKLVP